MAKPGMISQIQERLQNNTIINVAKNVGEEGAQIAAEYVAGLPFIAQLHAFMDRLFGPVASEWIGRGAGIAVATAVGTPDIFVSLVQNMTGVDHAAAERIVGETIDEFARNIVSGVKNKLTPEKAVENALDFTLAPKLLAVMDELDKISGILYKTDVAEAVHAISCKKMYVNGDVGREQGRAGFDINQNRPEKDQPKPEKARLIPNAKIMTFKEMLAQKVDTTHSSCECRGLTKEHAHLVDQPRNFRACRVILQKGSADDRLLEKQFFSALQRLRLASATEVPPMDLEAFTRQLEKPIWKPEEFKMAIRDWNPSDAMSLEELMTSAKLAFAIKDSWPDKLRHGGTQLLKAVFSGEDPNGALAKSRAFTSRVTVDAEKARLAVKASRKHRRANGY